MITAADIGKNRERTPKERSADCEHCICARRQKGKHQKPEKRYKPVPDTRRGDTEGRRNATGQNLQKMRRILSDMMLFHSKRSLY